MFCKAVSYINSAVDSVRPRTLAKLIVIYLHELQNRDISVRTGQTLLNPPNSGIRDHALQAGNDINTNYFKIFPMSELNTINISEIILIKKFSPDLNNQGVSTILKILGFN